MKTSILQNAMRILLGSLMILAGISHLTFQRTEFLAQVPRWLPDNPTFMDFIVISSGVVEIALGLAMLFLVKHRIKAGIALAIFYILIFPGNISQYTNGIDAFSLDTDQKRLIRLFFQPVLILWALWSTGALKKLFSKKSEKSMLLTILLLVFSSLTFAQETPKYQVSSHILDITQGKPAPNVKISLSKQDKTGNWTVIDEKLTDENGRINTFLKVENGVNQQGIYKLTYYTAPYFKAMGQESFYPFIEVVFVN